MPRSALLRTTLRADRATFDLIDAHAARAGYRSRGVYLLAAVAQALHALHTDALAGRPALPPATLDDLAGRTRRALAAIAGSR